MFMCIIALTSVSMVIATDNSQQESVNLTEFEVRISLLESRLQEYTSMWLSTDHKERNKGKLQGQNLHQNSGPTYVRWGRKSCPENGTELVYWGFVGGSWFEHTGGAANRLCMPSDPIWDPSIGTGGGAFLHGAEYEPTFSANAKSNFDVPCAVCRVKSRYTAVMVPGRNTCYPGWTQEYNGILTAGFNGHKSASEYLCLDKDAESVNHSDDNDNGCLFYFVQVQCTSLPCPPYQHGRRIACSVCSI